QVKLPIVGKIKLEGLTLDEAEEKLEALYDEFYVDSFVKLQFANKRVILLGALGGQVVPVENQNTSLFEILALAGGIDFGGKAHNIKVLRGDLQDPDVFEVDLSTVSKMKKTVIQVQPGDVVYVEPWRRPVLEVMRDISAPLSIVTSALTLIIVIQNLSDNNSGGSSSANGN
ncbi:MAG: polysaccharide export protein EpsE, partial [Cyclobacteriaceae bacterium]|nr:polysaccharide export protein EpsE [Cyclobacteriaceae bacterium HetDA_MAG_MS6]